MSTVRRKALLVGIDGLNLSRIDLVNAPTLRRLRDQAFFSTDRIYPDNQVMTVSGPGWATILTGTWPSKHGVLDNDIAGHRLSEFPDLLTRASRSGLRTFYCASWAPLYDRILTREVTHRYVISQAIWPGYELAVAGAAIDALTRDFDLGFVYLGSTDEQAHAHGALSPEYDRAIETADGYLAAFLRTIESRTGEDWLVFVSTDHGHRPEGGHGGQTDEERSTFVMAVGDGLPRHGPGGSARAARIVDIAPTLLEHLGIPVEAHWNLDGQSLHEVSGAR